MLMIESAGGRREDFEYPESSVELAQGGSQNGANTESPATCQIHLRIIFRVVTKHDLPASQTLKYPRRSAIGSRRRVPSGLHALGR